MAYWEFLLQKEGDRSWLPLESPDVEILEGRYRVVARSSQVNAPVEIRISHQVLDEQPPKRRIQSRLSQTNRDGLIVVMPFTRMQPGIWELCCRGDLMADMLGTGWRHTIQLQVLSQEAEVESWSLPWQGDAEEEDASTAAEQELASTASEGRVEAIEPPQESAVPLTPEPIVPELVSGVEETQPALELASEVIADEEVTEPEPAIAADTLISEISGFSSESSFAPEVLAAPEPLASGMLPTAEVTEATASGEEAEPAFELPIDLLTSDRMPLSQLAEQLSEQLVDSIFQELDETTAPLLAADQAAHVASSAMDGVYRLLLEQDAYVVRRGEALSLRGQVVRSEGESEAFSGEIRIVLRDPQRSLVLVEVQHPLTAQSLPLSFDNTLTVPTDYETHLLLGEVTLYETVADRSSAVATASFTATTALDELLEAIADEYSDSDLLQPPLEFAGEPDGELNLTFLDLVNAPQPLLQFQPSPQKSLPPQLHQPDPARPKQKALQLPFAAQPQPVALQTDLSLESQQELEPDVRADEAALTEAPPTEVPPADSPAVTAAPIPAAEAIDLTSELPLELQMPTPRANWLSPSEPVLGESATPEDRAFRSLNLKERFWSRLSALATDAELITSLRTVLPTEALSPLTAESAHVAGGADADLVAQEIVVDDELDDRSVFGQDDRSSSHAAEPLLDPPAALILAKDEPIPTPQLEVPIGELTAGAVVNFVVKLPNVAPRIYVKLWLRDRQTRLLLDGPRWLVDFLPTGLGALEARAQLTVPYGCLEIQFEAIAVEMATQRESHKVSVDRPVVPPDLPTLSLDELDV